MFRFELKDGGRVYNRQGIKYGPWIVEVFNGPTDDDYVGMVHRGGKIALTGVSQDGTLSAWFTTKKAARQALKELRFKNNLAIDRTELGWYVGGNINGQWGYLHKDGTFRNSTYGDKGYTGYYASRRLARMALKQYHGKLYDSFPV